MDVFPKRTFSKRTFPKKDVFKKDVFGTPITDVYKTSFLKTSFSVNVRYGRFETTVIDVLKLLSWTFDYYYNGLF